MKSSLKRDGPEMARICACAGKNKIVVMLGYSENANHSLYLSQSLIGKDGEIKMNRRKIKSTHVERTLYGDGSGASLHNVVEEPGIGKVGALSCWEHSQPLLRYHTYSQGEEIHVAAWPPMNYFNSFPEGSALWSQCREGMYLKNLYPNLNEAFNNLSQGLATSPLHTPSNVTASSFCRLPFTPRLAWIARSSAMESSTTSAVAAALASSHPMVGSSRKILGRKKRVL